MKEKLTLGLKGVRALVALCAHVESNGNMAVDAKYLANVLVNTAEAREDAQAWRAAELEAGYSGGCSMRLKRLAEARAELEERAEEIEGEIRDRREKS